MIESVKLGAEDLERLYIPLGYTYQPVTVRLCLLYLLKPRCINLKLAVKLDLNYLS